MGVLSKNRADLARAGDCRANRLSSGAAIEPKQQWTAIRRRPNRVGLPGKSADRVCGHYGSARFSATKSALLANKARTTTQMSRKGNIGTSYP